MSATKFISHTPVLRAETNNSRMNHELRDTSDDLEKPIGDPAPSDDLNSSNSPGIPSAKPTPIDSVQLNGDPGTSKEDIDQESLGEANDANSQEFRYIKRRIFILGAGGIGGLVAHSLRTIPDAPRISFIFYKSDHFRSFIRKRGTLTLFSEGVQEDVGDIDAEYHSLNAKVLLRFNASNQTSEQLPLSDERQMPIYHLVVALKCPRTVNALLDLKPRLGPWSTIVFLQNGMGVIEEVNEKVFPDSRDRPSYISGVVTHGMTVLRDFVYEHNGRGSIALALMPKAENARKDLTGAMSEVDWTPSALFMHRILMRTIVLGTRQLSPTQFIQSQMRKLATNCVINPLTAIMDCENGELLSTFYSVKLGRLILAEIALVFKSLPELQNLHSDSILLTPARLEEAVVGIARNTAKNMSSMLQDVHAGRETEVDYMNGYIVKRGEELGIRCIVNYTVAQMVKARAHIQHEAILGGSERLSQDTDLEARQRSSSI